MATAHFKRPIPVDTIHTPRRETPSTPPETPKNESDSDSPAPKKTGKSIIEFPYDLEVARDENGAYIEFGRGVWSTVYKATSNMSASPKMMMVMMMTPPSSPVISTSTNTSRVVAVKTPLRRDAHPILRAEAYILSWIAQSSPSSTSGGEEEEEEEYVVPFFGYIPSSGALVLQALPLSLSTHIETCADHARKSFSTRTMFDPVTPKWRALATQLIKGLDWLHSEIGLVHGDIKPHNVLLRPRHSSSSSLQSLQEGEMEYDALYADFSSSHFVSSTHTVEGATTGEGALTPPYAAPELLTLSAMKSSTPLTTPASDIFALALTLLAAATGDVLLYAGTSAMQRLAMSREGWRALDYVRSGANASRLGRGKDGFVGRVVQRGIRREAESRPTAREWLELFA